MQLCHHMNAGGSPDDFGAGKSDTSCLPVITRASPATTSSREKQHIQPIKNEEKVKNWFLTLIWAAGGAYDFWNFEQV